MLMWSFEARLVRAGLWEVPKGADQGLDGIHGKRGDLAEQQWGAQ